MMPFNYKKEYKTFYLPPKTPGIVTVPAMNFLAVRGQGNPNEEDGAYKQAIGMLYAVAFTIVAMKEYVKTQGYKADFREGRLHHEIYLSDVRRCKPEQLKTVIRHPIKRREKE